MGCYFCGGEVTGSEHIPPKSFFPKGKRQDLITVGSCDIHNQEKSKEDEYIRAILLASIKLDGQEHMEELRDTNSRALERSIDRICGKELAKELAKEQAKEIIEIIEKHRDDPVGGAKAASEIVAKGIMSLGLVGLLNKDAQEETVVDNDGVEVKTASFIYDRERLNNFFECVARGVFFYEIGERWVGGVNILPHTFLRDDAPQRDKDLSHYYLQHFDRSRAKGAQKEYFCYEGVNEINPKSGNKDSIFFNFCIFNTFYFTAIFML